MIGGIIIFTEKNKIVWNSISARKSRTYSHHTGFGEEKQQSFETVHLFLAAEELTSGKLITVSARSARPRVPGEPNSHLVTIMRKKDSTGWSKAWAGIPVSFDCIQTVPGLPSAGPYVLLSILSTRVLLRGCLRSLSNRPSHEMDFSTCLQFYSLHLCFLLRLIHQQMNIFGQSENREYFHFFKIITKN